MIFLCMQQLSNQQNIFHFHCIGFKVTATTTEGVTTISTDIFEPYNLTAGNIEKQAETFAESINNMLQSGLIIYFKIFIFKHILHFAQRYYFILSVIIVLHSIRPAFGS